MSQSLRVSLSEFNEWQENRVTRAFFKLLRSTAKSHREALSQGILGSKLGMEEQYRRVLSSSIAADIYENTPLIEYDELLEEDVE